MQTIEQLRCGRCGYRWFPRSANRPVKCPECQSREWDSTDEKKDLDNIK